MIKHKKRKIYYSSFEFLHSLSIRNEKINNRYCVFHITDNFHLYARITKGGKCFGIFLDGTLIELKEILLNIEGISFSHEGIVAMPEFNLFSPKQTIDDSERQYIAWQAKFESDESCDRFFKVCEEFGQNGIESATQKASTYPQKLQKITSKLTFGNIRIGQNDFRKNLLKHWKSCAVTGLKVTSLLKASHIKPWAKSTPKEKLDPFNGLLLIPNLDTLFDNGLISFNSDGKIITSSKLSHAEFELLGVTAELKIRKLNEAHLPYLTYHFENIFKE